MSTNIALNALRGQISELAPERGFWVDGKGQAAPAGATFAVIDPATAQEITQISDCSPAQAIAAVDSADRALPAWAATAPRERADILRRVYELMRENIDGLAALLSLENGKSLADSRGEVLYAADFFRWFAEEAVRSEGDYGVSPAGGTRTLITHRPVGIAVLITPWNFPAAMATRKIGPALAAGCTVVLKPASETPLTALAIMHLLTQAGVPPGVVNLVPTSSSRTVVAALMADPRVRKVSFTGSTQVGQALLKQAADRVLNSSMELGGNAPFVVAADADVDAAVAGAIIAKFRNGGQACTAANRFFVHEDVVEEFGEKFGSAVAAQVVGAGLSAETQVGPVVNRAAQQRIEALIASAVADGARISHQARIPVGSPGFYVAPTVIRDVTPGAEIVREEIFGPVAPIITWRDRDEMLRQVNDCEFGLASYVFSSDLRWALELAEAIDAGMVGINRGLVSDPAAPFGGVKQSGLGREGAREGLREFQETQYFSVDW